MDVIPLFPLSTTVFFPGSILPLRIFERRYLDLIRDCMRENTGFGICLIKEGSEVGDATEVFLQGTYARVIDWDQTSDGLLQITVKGDQRFVIHSHHLAASGVRQAEIEWLKPSPQCEVPNKHHDLKLMFERLVEDFFPQYKDEQPLYSDCSWLGYRLAECLPFDPLHKQMLLETEQPIERLEILRSLMQGGMEDDEDDES